MLLPPTPCVALVAALSDGFPGNDLDQPLGRPDADKIVSLDRIKISHRLVIGICPSAWQRPSVTSLIGNIAAKFSNTVDLARSLSSLGQM